MKKKVLKKRIILIGYKLGSQSLKNLQQCLKEQQQDRDVLRVDKNSTKYKRRPSDVVVAWGPVAPCPHVDVTQELAKEIANNKLEAFLRFKDHAVRTPEWTTDPNQVEVWVDAGNIVVGRTLLNSHSGKGIVMFGGDHTKVITYAPLYTLYKKKKHEYRVHVFNNEVIDVTQKKKQVGHEGTNHQIRNHQNGWVYCREGVVEPKDLRELALGACSALGLRNGAVDIIWNEKENLSYVLEVNTAPGIEGTTCLKYANAILGSIQNG